MTVQQLRAAMARMWDLYTSRRSNPAQVDAAYEAWSRMVAELHVLTHDRTTRRTHRETR